MFMLKYLQANMFFLVGTSRADHLLSQQARRVYCPIILAKYAYILYYIFYVFPIHI